jgi:hypothetical protein
VKHRVLAALFLVPALALLAAGCNQAIIQSPPVPGNPCGDRAQVCEVRAGKAWCCDLDQTCGVKGTVSEGMCPFSGESAMARGLGGSKGPHMMPQWTPASPEK